MTFPQPPWNLFGVYRESEHERLLAEVQRTGVKHQIKYGFASPGSYYLPSLESRSADSYALALALGRRTTDDSSSNRLIQTGADRRASHRRASKPLR